MIAPGIYSVADPQLISVSGYPFVPKKGMMVRVLDSKRPAPIGGYLQQTVINGCEGFVHEGDLERIFDVCVGQ